MKDEPKAIVPESPGVTARIGRKLVQGANRAGFLDAYGFLRSRVVKRKLAILVYHRIEEPSSHPWSSLPATPGDFELEMKYLRRNYQVISLDELSAASGDFNSLPPQAAVITIDDGFKCTYAHAYPILKKYNLPATVFLTTGPIDNRSMFWFDRVRYVIWKTGLDIIELGEMGTYRLSSTAERQGAGKALLNRLKQLQVEDRDEFIERLVRLSGVEIPLDLGKELVLSWDEIKEMSRNGIDFGAHTVSHPVLTGLPLEAARKEIVDSKHRIEEELGRPVTAFCYPYGHPGDYNSDIEVILGNNGFKCAVICEPESFVPKSIQPYRLPRIDAQRNFGMFKFYMSGLYFDTVAKCGK